MIINIISEYSFYPKKENSFERVKKKKRKKENLKS